MAPVCVLDSCVLYPVVVRDPLLTLAILDAFEPRWTEAILDEMTRNVLADHPTIDPSHFEAGSVGAIRRGSRPHLSRVEPVTRGGIGRLRNSWSQTQPITESHQECRDGDQTIFEGTSEVQTCEVAAEAFATLDGSPLVPVGKVPMIAWKRCRRRATTTATAPQRHRPVRMAERTRTLSPDA
jgi:hypothetical protein